MPGKIFINYRRDDSPGDARGVRDALTAKFGKSSVFMDVDNLLAGQRFDHELAKALDVCDVLVAIIGARWLELLRAKAAGGERDYVLEEIAAALKRGIVVVPVRVGREGQMPALPKSDELPADIRELVLYQKQDIAHERFGRDMAELINAITVVQRSKFRPSWSEPRARWGWFAAGCAILAGSYVGGHYAGLPLPLPSIAPSASNVPSERRPSASTSGPGEPDSGRSHADVKPRATAVPERDVAKFDDRAAKKPSRVLPGAETGWTMPTGDHSNRRYSVLDQINATNVKNLQLSWSFSTGVLRGHEGNPLVVDRTMYVHTPFPNNVYALDLDQEGAVKWKYEPRIDPSVITVMCCDTVNRGTAYADGKIFLYQADTTLVALDARTGKELWKTVNGDPKRGESATNAPAIINDKVIVGLSGGEFGVRGHVTAYDTRNGRRLWRAYASGPDSDILFDPEKTMSLGKPVGKNSSLKTWTGDQWKIGGGTAWGWFSYDEDANLVYYGTGNPSTWNPVQRAGPDGKPIDQKWTASIIARNPDTGVAAWAYQMTPFDEWNYDGVNEMILVDLDIGGSRRRALVHFDKNGIGYTLDRISGEPLVAEKFLATTNWTTGVNLNKTSPLYGRPSVVSAKSPFLNGTDVNSKDICPSSAGAKNQGPAAFSALSGLFYVPVNALCMDYEPFKVSYTVGQPYVGATLSMFPVPGKASMGNFIAWDAAAGRIVWSKDELFPVWSGALATAGGIVCYGTLEGHLKCLDQKDGRELYKYKMPSGIVGNVMTYMHDGRQYIAVLSGVGGWAGIGLAAGLTNPSDGLGMVGAMAGLKSRTSLGGSLHVFALP